MNYSHEFLIFSKFNVEYNRKPQSTIWNAYELFEIQEIHNNFDHIRKSFSPWDKPSV